jgi:hypothetical protein
LAIPARAPVLVSPTRPDAGRGPGAFGSGSPTPVFADRGTQGLSGSWGTPVCLCPVLRPRQDRSVRPYDACGMAPVCDNDEGSHDEALSGLYSRASARAVYASPLGSPQDDARLASGCLASFPGGIGYPQGSYERFPVCFLHPFLLPQAFLTQCHSPLFPPRWRVGPRNTSSWISGTCDFTTATAASQGAAAPWYPAGLCSSLRVR